MKKSILGILAILFFSTNNTIAQERSNKLIFNNARKTRTNTEPSNIKDGQLYALEGGSIAKIDPLNLLPDAFGWVILDKSAFNQPISGICYDRFKDEIVGITEGILEPFCPNDNVKNVGSLIVRYKDNNDGTYTFLGKTPINNINTTIEYFHNPYDLSLSNPNNTNNFLHKGRADIEYYQPPYIGQSPLPGSKNGVILTADNKNLILYGINGLDQIIRIIWDYNSSVAFAEPIYNFSNGDLCMIQNGITINSKDIFKYSVNLINISKPILTGYERVDEIIITGSDECMNVNYAGNFYGNINYSNVSVAKFELNGTFKNVNPILTNNFLLCTSSPSIDATNICSCFNICDIPSPNINSYSSTPSNYDSFVGNDLFFSKIIGYNPNGAPITAYVNNWVQYSASEYNEVIVNTICNPIDHNFVPLDYAGKYNVNWEKILMSY